MTQAQEKEFVSMQNDIHQIKQDLGKLDKKVDKVVGALMGNDIAKDGGLISRITELEEENQSRKEEIDTLKQNNQRFEIYQRIIWAAVGGIGVYLLTYTLNAIFKH